jgi:hypothetical protein
MRRTLWTAYSQPWDGAALRGFITVVAGLPWVLRRRREVPTAVERRLRLLESRR